jgi:phosphohistidine phosphatase
MKKLVFIRHAKSSWSDPFLDDFNRPLNKRGKKNAPFMAKKLKEKGVLPDLIISSSAIRAKTTANIFNEIFQCNNILYKDALYDTTLDILYNTIQQIENRYNTVFLFGHNPSLNFLCEQLVDLDANIPTTGIVVITSNTNNWEQFISSKLNLDMFIYPKNYEILH